MDEVDQMSRMEVIDEYPLPFSEEEVVKIQEESLEDEYGLRDEDEIIEGVDEFHDRYIEELTRTDSWVFFRNHWLSGGNYVYVWNTQSGYGFKFKSGWEVACSFVDAWDQFTDEHDSSEFEPAHYAWELP